MTHPAAELLRAIADGKKLERITDTLIWRSCTTGEALHLISSGFPMKVRTVHPTVTRQISYPEPLRVKPEYGYSYWAPSLGYIGPATVKWCGDQYDNIVFAAGMAFATEAAAAEAHKALFGAGT